MKGEYNMVYLDRINELLESTILKNTTSKILQHMGRIRNASSLEQARRWVMELLQNARDVSKEDGIKISVKQLNSFSKQTEKSNFFPINTLYCT